MIKKLATLIGYAKAPRATHLLRHPVEGTRTLLALRGLKSLATKRTAAIVGAAVAVPVGLAAWKVAAGGEEDEG